MKTQTKGVLITLLAAACFGVASPIAKWVYSFGVSAGTMLVLRFMMATVLIWGYVLLVRKDLNPRLHKGQVILLALTGGGMYFVANQGYFHAIEYIPICIQIMIFYTYPFIVNVLSIFFFKKKMGLIQVIALIAAFIGILMTVSMDDMHLNFIGCTLCLIGALGNAVYLMLLEKKAVAEVNSIVIVAYVVTFTCLSFLIWTGVQGGFTADMLEIPLPAWIGIFAIAVFTTLMGTIALSVGIKYVGSAKAAIISVFEPVEAILLGVLLFQERLTGRGWIGIFLVIGAILLVNLQKAKNE